MPSRDWDQQPLHATGREDSDLSSDTPPKKKFVNGYCCYKTLVFTYCAIFLIIGLSLLGIGAWLAKVKGAYESINNAATAPVILALVLGLLMVVFAFIGLVGAIREKIVLLKIFLAVAIVVFLGQVIVGILAFIYREKTIEVVNKQLTFALEEYERDDDVTRGVDYIQRRFTCCGLKIPIDWEKNEVYACDSDDADKQCGVPDSCCKTETEDCGQNTRTVNGTSAADHVFRQGCTDKFRTWLEYNLDVVGGTALGLALLHVLGIFLVYFFITAVQDRVWLFSYRKRYYDN